MSAVRQFSMSALAGLMIQEEENEESFMEDDETHDKSHHLNNTGDKSFASTQYSADYDHDEFEQEESVLLSPSKDTYQQTDDYFDKEEEDDEEERKPQDEEEGKVNEGAKSSIMESKSGLTSNSGSVFDYSDSQNDGSSRTIFAMPDKKITLSPPNRNSSPNIRTRNYDELEFISGVDVSDEPNNNEIVENNIVAEVEEEPPVEDSSLIPIASNESRKLSPQINDFSKGAKPSFSPTESQKVFKPSHIRQAKGYSTVRRLNANDIQKIQSVAKSSAKKIIATSSNSLPASGQRINFNDNISFDDVKLMKDVRDILNKIERNEVTSQENHRKMARQSVKVLGVNLGSGSPSKHVSRRSDEMKKALHEKNIILNSDEESSVFSKISFYDEDDTRDVNLSQDTSPDIPLGKSEVVRTSRSITSQKIPPSTKSPPQDLSEKSRVRGLSNPPKRRGAPKPSVVPPAFTEEYSRLSKLAEETYATFLSDIIEIAKARASDCNVSSVEELAMHRSLSQHLFDTFAQPNAVKDVRKKMIDAAVTVDTKGTFR